MASMTSEHDYDVHAAELLESILDQGCLDTGMSAEELSQAKIIAQIEVRLLDEGRSIEDIYQEWAREKPSEIINKYSYKLKEKTKKAVQGSSEETTELHGRFLLLKQGHPPVVYLGIINQEDASDAQELPHRHLPGVLEFPVEASLLPRFASLKPEQPVRVRMRVDFTEQEPQMTIISVAPDKVPHPTFTPPLGR